MTTESATILVVDDEMLNLELLEALLGPEGYRIECASGAEEALAMIGQRLPDLILLDVMMPGMDGYQLAERLKADPVTSPIPIVMVSALDDRAARLKGLNAGAEDFLTKPVDRAELWLRVRNLLRLKSVADILQNHSAILERQVLERTADLQRFRSAMDATVDAIFLMSRTTTRFVEVNSTACEMLGYTREELFAIGPSQLSVTPGEELEQVYDAIVARQGAKTTVETRMRRKDGTEVQVQVKLSAQAFGDDWIIVVVAHDIAERKEAERRLHQLAHFDALTGLPNRTMFNEALRKLLAQAARDGWKIAVMLIDLDHFKNVNDTLGHAIGDDLLRQFGDRLSGCVRIRDTVGRLGGDEFALILAMSDGPQGASVVAGKIRDALRKPFCLSGHEVLLTASVGITICPDDAFDPATLLQYADTAMYSAKHSGRDTFRFFTAQMNADVLARRELETALRKAVENGEFVLHYQPKVQLTSGRIVGVEALLRWMRPGHGMVSPRDFIPALEETGLIVRVGRWVIETACKQIGGWLAASTSVVPISVNVSARQFVDGDLEGDVVSALQDAGIPSDLLELELTESSLMTNAARTVAILGRLKQRGVRISIDDFGTGYSSLAYLRRFPIDKLKIDIAFVRDITSDPDAASIARTIISMAHSLKLDVIAEGVETAAQLAYLRRHHCDQIQGYHFSPPVPVDELEQMLRDDLRLAIPDQPADESLRTLLLVDDEAQVLNLLHRLLLPDGYHILLATSAKQGFELLALHPVDVILCDERMPGMTGTAFLDRVKDLYPATVRIVLSGRADLELVVSAINRGTIHRYYSKPWNSAVLRDNIRDAFGPRRMREQIGKQNVGVDQAAAFEPGKETGLPLGH